jgi:hypothetical protein
MAASKNAAHDHERAPLLPSDVEVATKKRTPLPRLQISIALFMRLSEPIALMCIVPFINQAIARDPTLHLQPSEVGLPSPA